MIQNNNPNQLLNMKSHVAAFISLALIGFFVSGCVVSRSTSIEESGRKIGESTLNQLENQVTTQDWVQAVLGEPTRKAPVSEATEIWVYEYMLKKEKSMGVIVLLSSDDETVESQSVYLEFTDGILTRHWTER